MDFSRQESENTDLTTMMDGLGRNCPRLQNIHIASIRLSHAVVLSLTAANLRFVVHIYLWLSDHLVYFFDQFAEIKTCIDYMLLACVPIFSFPMLYKVGSLSQYIATVRNLTGSLIASIFRGLRMLSLVLGTGITDASVAAIASSYSNLELLDLSG